MKYLIRSTLAITTCVACIYGHAWSKPAPIEAVEEVKQYYDTDSFLLWYQITGGRFVEGVRGDGMSIDKTEIEEN